MKNRLSRRQLLGAGLAAAASSISGIAARVGVAQRAGAGPASAPPDQIVLINGRIHTMDRNNTVVQTVSIRNGRFSAVGGTAPGPGAGIRMIDLKGRSVVPGIIDNHNHIALMGNRPGYHTPLENALSIKDVQEIIAARAGEIPRGAWITTIGGFHRNQLVAPDQAEDMQAFLADLDQTYSELARLTKENNDLRIQLARLLSVPVEA